MSRKSSPAGQSAQAIQPDMHSSSSPLLTLSWEDIEVYTPEKKARNWPIFGQKEVPPKNIVKKGKNPRKCVIINLKKSYFKECFLLKSVA